MDKIGHPKAIDLDAASKLDAEATLLGREVLSRMVRASAEWQTTKCAFGMRGTIICIGIMAILFMLTERLHIKGQCPLLSCADIERLLEAFLPRRDASPERVYSHVKRRHEMRRRTILSHAKRNAQRRFKVV